MRIIRQIFYEIINAFRDKSGISSMIIFPIAFMIILGAALSGAFNNVQDINPVEIIYYDNGEKEAKEIFNTFKDNSNIKNITFKEVGALEEGKKEISKDSYRILVELKGNNIKVYKNEKEGISVNIVMAALNSISERYGAINTIVKVAPETLEGIDNNFDMGYIKTNKIEMGRQLTSYDYYGIVEITMMFLYGSLFGFFSIYNGRRMRIEGRIFSTGVSKLEYVFCKFASNFIITIITLIPAFLFSIFVMKTYWGDNPLALAGILLSFNVFCSALGVSFGYFFKDDKLGQLILNSLVFPVITFLGGGYVYIGGNTTGIFDFVTKLSPLRWVNRSIINIAYDNNYSMFKEGIVINLILGMLLLISAVILKKEEA